MKIRNWRIRLSHILCYLLSKLDTWKIESIDHYSHNKNQKCFIYGIIPIISNTKKGKSSNQVGKVIVWFSKLIIQDFMFWSIAYPFLTLYSNYLIIFSPLMMFHKKVYILLKRTWNFGFLFSETNFKIVEKYFLSKF